jgi:uncharacterized protein YfbU (UPF0304 family)
MKTKEIDDILKKIPNEKKSEASLIATKLKYMEEKLAEIQKQIDEQGVVEHFINGKQDFLRESPALASYTKLMKIYDTFYKNLINLLPKEVVEELNDELDDYVND